MSKTTTLTSAQEQLIALCEGWYYNEIDVQPNDAQEIDIDTIMKEIHGEDVIIDGIGLTEDRQVTILWTFNDLEKLSTVDWILMTIDTDDI
jgi:hypothetical protein